MNAPKIVVCNTIDEELASIITNYGFELYKAMEEVPSEREHDVQVILGGVRDKAYLKRLPNLSFMQLSSAGINGYDDLSLYANPDVTLATASGVYSGPIAEYVIGGMLCLGKRSIANYVSSRGFLFNRSLKLYSQLDIELSKARVGVWGCGDIGRTIARKLKALGLRECLRSIQIWEKPR